MTMMTSATLILTLPCSYPHPLPIPYPLPSTPSVINSLFSPPSSSSPVLSRPVRRKRKSSPAGPAPTTSAGTTIHTLIPCQCYHMHLLDIIYLPPPYLQVPPPPSLSQPINSLTPSHIPPSSSPINSICQRSSSACGLIFRCEMCPMSYCEDCAPIDMDAIGTCLSYTLAIIPPPHPFTPSPRQSFSPFP